MKIKYGNIVLVSLFTALQEKSWRVGDTGLNGRKKENSMA
jgi:hypothetical protein